MCMNPALIITTIVPRYIVYIKIKVLYLKTKWASRPHHPILFKSSTAWTRPKDRRHSRKRPTPPAWQQAERKHWAIQARTSTRSKTAQQTISPFRHLSMLMAPRPLKTRKTKTRISTCHRGEAKPSAWRSTEIARVPSLHRFRIAQITSLLPEMNRSQVSRRAKRFYRLCLMKRSWYSRVNTRRKSMK